MYDGTERRKENIDLITKTSLLEERLHGFMEKTEEFRDILCVKIDEVRVDIKELKDKISEFPCKERAGWYQSLSKQIVFMWGLISVIVLALMKELFFK